jgi:hypothetical protein
MKKSHNFHGAMIGVSLSIIMPPVFCHAAPVPGQQEEQAVSGAAVTPGQTGTVPEGREFSPKAVPFATSLTFKSYTISASGTSGNLEGESCPGSSKMISGACHPSYNPSVTIINQFPNTGLNTWRCGFKNNTAASVTVWIYTVCAQ